MRARVKYVASHGLQHRARALERSVAAANHERERSGLCAAGASGDGCVQHRKAAILRRGRILVWFPEGHRSPDGQLQPFKRGVGVLMQGYCVARGLAGKLSARHDIDLQNVTLYWHFATITALTTALVTGLFPLAVGGG